MLFMNIMRKFGGHVYQEEASAEGGSPAAAAPTGEPAKAEPGAEPVKQEPAKQEPAKAEPAAEVHAMDTYIEQYTEGKPALALALGFLKDAGISPEDPAFVLAETENDFTLIEALLAKAGLSGTDHMLGILKGEVQAYMDLCEQTEEQTKAEVAGILGEQNDAIIDWARENAAPEEKEVINSLLEAGGLYARAAAMLLQSAYSGADVTKAAANPVQFSSQAEGGAPLTAREFSQKVDELAKKHNGDPRGSYEYQQLAARREQARKRGF